MSAASTAETLVEPVQDERALQFLAHATGQHDDDEKMAACSGVLRKASNGLVSTLCIHGATARMVSTIVVTPRNTIGSHARPRSIRRRPGVGPAKTSADCSPLSDRNIRMSSATIAVSTRLTTAMNSKRDAVRVEERHAHHNREDRGGDELRRDAADQQDLQSGRPAREESVTAC